MAYTTINDSSAYFQVQPYDGNNTNPHNITNTGNSNLRPDFLWIKRTTGNNDHTIFNSPIGSSGNRGLSWNGSYAAYSIGFGGFLTDGFQITATGETALNNASESYVSYQWAAGGATPSKTYKVVVVSDSGNKYRFRNSTDTATFAASAVTLELQSGGTYTFDQSDSSNSGHPLRFSTTSDGSHGGGSEYTTGVTTNGTPGQAGAYTRLNVQNTTTLYYYCTQHSGMGGQADQNATFGQTNFDGSILCRSTENSTSGISIIRHTGTGSAGTIGHGLGSVPDVVVTKCLSTASDWAIYQKQMGNEYYLEANSNNDRQTASSVWGDTTPTALSYTVGGANGKNNASSATYISYCFKSVKGFSKFGAYKGTTNADGAFVYTGFKPAFIFLKNYQRSGQNYRLYDSKRPGYNLNNKSLIPNTNDAAAASNQLDILSNGFKLKTNDGDSNGYSQEHIYWAFAESPLVASNNVVGTAY